MSLQVNYYYYYYYTINAGTTTSAVSAIASLSTVFIFLQE